MYCKTCLFPDTKPDLFFNEEGICDACISAKSKEGKVKSIDWNKRSQEFNDLIDKYRSKDGTKYDCIVPVSGGKDSTFQVYAMKIIHKMNPLAVTFDQFDQTPIGIHNLEVLREIGVDHIHFTMNPKVVRKLVKKGLKIVGDPHWINHVGIFTIPVKIAVAFKIPLIIWGENPQFEYGGPATNRESKVLDKRWRQEFSGMRGFREEDMVDDEISMADLKALEYPSDEDVKTVGVTGLFYGYFHKWNAREHTKLIQTLGWKPLPKPWPGSYMEHENCDMKFLDIREHLKWVKYGYGRVTDQVNIDIRSGIMKREDALKIVRENDGKFSQEHKTEFCKYIGITEKEFDEIRDTFVNTDILEKIGNEWKLKVEPN